MTPANGRSHPSRDEITAALEKSLASSVVPVDEELWERRMRALTLRNMGGTFRQIAAELGCSPDTVRADVRVARTEIMSAGNEERMARQLSILMDMTRGAYPGALQGDKDSIMAIVRCLEQEAKLCGMYAPTKQAPGVGDIDFARDAAELIGRLGLQPPKELMMAWGNAGRDMTVTAEVSEIIDGVIERITVDGAPIGFDVVAQALAFGDEGADREVERTISDEAVSAAAAEAITGGERADDNAPWSNL